MSPLIKSLKIIEGINDKIGKYCSLIVILLMLCVSYNVGCRYLLNRPSDWGIEFNGYLLLAITFLGGGNALLHDSHVKLSIVQNKFSKRIRSLIDSITYLIFFGVIVVLTYFGGEIAIESFQNNTISPSMWGPKLWPSQILIPIGAILLGLQGLVNWVRNLSLLFFNKGLTTTNMEVINKQKT